MENNHLEGFSGHGGSSLQHAVSNTQQVSVLEEGCHKGDILGAAPRLKQTQCPLFRVPPDIIQDQVKSSGWRAVGLEKRRDTSKDI